ncbi:MAG TPA: hypothetical protein DCP64_08855, partial [Sarcina sp.]|nr:hypothetical protein [Sarcina sp.]
MRNRPPAAGPSRSPEDRRTASCMGSRNRSQRHTLRKGRRGDPAMKEWHSDRAMELLKENLILKESLQKRETFIRRTFGRYLTDEVLEELLNDSNGLRIGGERREVTILISDIRQSTELSEKMDPVSFFRMLNHYFEEMIEIINAWRGNILDFVGDSIVAVFGAPKPNELSARDATACAVAMQRRM